MSVSQNGWPVIELGTDERLAIIPKIAGRVRKGDVEYIFKRLIEEFDTRVEDIDLGKDDWGFANRNAYGSSQKSDHASGTAIDVNASKHPIGVANTFSHKQVTEIRKIVKELKGAVVWGGEWARPDDMHFSIAVSETELAKIVKKLKNAEKPKPEGNPYIKERQRRLRYAGYYSGPVNGLSSPAYVSAIKKYQRSQKAPYTLVADGVWGSRTEEHFQWVKKLQTSMNAKTGTNTGAKLYVDGDYGAVTVLKVKNLQRKYKGGIYKGIVDGVAGPMFCRAIGVPNHP